MLVEDQKRLAKIDGLYALRLDKHVSLPMLVVVGDQSSGKSSVLEGLTGLPFPRDAGLCTRFPTQVVFKRSKDTRVNIQVLPFEPEEHSETEWTVFDDDINVFDESCFLQALSKACQRMNLPQPGEHVLEGFKSFSKDVLKIELSGPGYDHFSVVDLPGLFRKPIPGVTNKEDMDYVKGMVKTYLKSRRSIILAVVPSNVDLATQEIVQMAEDADISGKRTLGVLTKPDLVDKGAEPKIIELVTSPKCRFALGYTLVCNRSQSKLCLSHKERNENEKQFFSIAPWNQIPSNRAGIAALRGSLNKLLIDSARESFADVTQDINSAIAACKHKLTSIGLPRSTEMRQRVHLIEIATSYQRLTYHALDAYYGRDSCFSLTEELRLATTIKSCQENFSTVIRRDGHTRAFGRRRVQASNNVATSPDESEYSSLSDQSDAEGDLDLNYSAVNATAISLTLHKNLHLNFRSCNNPERTPKDSIYEWIRKEYDSSKGFEMGGINPAILPTLYHEQIKYWRYHTYTHLRRVIHIVHSFIFKLIEHLCSDTEIAVRLRDVLMKPLQDCYAEVVKQAELLLDIEEHGNLRTLNHYFALTLNKVRLKRHRKRLEKSKTWTSNDGEREPLLRLSDILKASANNEEHVVDDLHDTLKSYYKVARKQFVDAIVKGPVDYLLLVDGKGPLQVFSPSYVGSLSSAELAKIAGETKDVTIARTNLEQEMELLQAGLEVLQG